MSHHDLAMRWDHLLVGLDHARRLSILKALKNSLDTGYPATSEGVQLLVAFARGQISARQYSARILLALGFHPAPPAPVPQLSSWGDNSEESLQMPTLQPRQRLQNFEPSAPSVDNPPTASTYDGLRHQPSRPQSETVQMYLTGQIPMEEFLRRQQSRAATSY